MLIQAYYLYRICARVYFSFWVKLLLPSSQLIYENLTCSASLQRFFIYYATLRETANWDVYDNDSEGRGGELFVLKQQDPSLKMSLTNFSQLKLRLSNNGFLSQQAHFFLSTSAHTKQF